MYTWEAIFKKIKNTTKMCISICTTPPFFICWFVDLFVTDNKEKFDEEVEAHGVRILVDGKSVMHIIGTQMDFVTDRLRWVIVTVW